MRCIKSCLKNTHQRCRNRQWNVMYSKFSKFRLFWETLLWSRRFSHQKSESHDRQTQQTMGDAASSSSRFFSSLHICAINCKAGKRRLIEFQLTAECACHLGLRRRRPPSAQGAKAHKGLLLLTGFCCCLFTRSLSHRRRVVWATRAYWKLFYRPAGWFGRRPIVCCETLRARLSTCRQQAQAATQLEFGETETERERKRDTQSVYERARRRRWLRHTMGPPQWGVDDTWRTLSSALEISVNTECPCIDGYLHSNDRLGRRQTVLCHKWGKCFGFREEGLT